MTEKDKEIKSDPKFAMHTLPTITTLSYISLYMSIRNHCYIQNTGYGNTVFSEIGVMLQVYLNVQP